MRLQRKFDNKVKDDFSLETDLSLIQELIKNQVIEPFASCETIRDIRKIILADFDRFKNILTLKGKDALDIPHG